MDLPLNFFFFLTATTQEVCLSTPPLPGEAVRLLYFDREALLVILFTHLSLKSSFLPAFFFLVTPEGSPFPKHFVLSCSRQMVFDVPPPFLS